MYARNDIINAFNKKIVHIKIANLKQKKKNQQKNQEKKSEEEFKKYINNTFTFIEEISKGINNDFFTKYFNFLKPSALAK